MKTNNLLKQNKKFKLKIINLNKMLSIINKKL